ncbi:hypothetical protein FGO68_gene3491 [Halteria grandinella]|uniref:Uncharacterized protein n=1 Tax=Halteria grandinella TaxID=5974 RepID=A0A8J8P899_HALGN|nr:hypothetical protein FGO68_gene3491 [Halteria grandinella]
MEVIFGYKREVILDKNISVLMPRGLQQHHDGFVRDYLVKGDISWNDTIKRTFGQTKEGFLIKIDLIVKLIPRIDGELKLAGMIQRAPPEIKESQTYKKGMQNCTLGLVQHMIMTDRQGFIQAISIGLVQRLGLHPKFFNYKNESVIQMMNLEEIAENIVGPDNDEKLQTEGLLWIFDTTNIMTKIQGESLTTEDLNLIHPHFKQLELFVRQAKIPLRNQDYALVYLLQSLREQSSEQNLLSQQNQGGFQSLDGSNLGSPKKFGSDASESEKFNMSSASSSTGSSNSFSSLIRDFKKSLLERKQPRALHVLDWIVFASLLLTVVMATIYYLYLRSGDSDLELAAMTTQAVDLRRVYLTQTAIHVNTYIGLANNLYINSFPFQQLNSIIKRSDNMLSIVNQIEQLAQQKQNEIIQIKRGMQSEDYHDSYEGLYSEYEMQRAELLIVDEKNYVINQELTMKSAIQNYLLEVSMMQLKELSDHWIPVDYITRPIVENKSAFSNSLPSQKASYFLYANGLRKIRKLIDDSAEYFHELVLQFDSNSNLFTIMIISVLIAFSSMCFVFYQFYQIEAIQREIFSLYAYLPMEQIKDTYNKVKSYMFELLEGSFLQQILPNDNKRKENCSLIRMVTHREAFQESFQSSQASERINQNSQGSIYLMMIKRASNETKEMILRNEKQQELNQRTLFKKTNRLQALDAEKPKATLQNAFDKSDYVRQKSSKRIVITQKVRKNLAQQKNALDIQQIKDSIIKVKPQYAKGDDEGVEGSKARSQKSIKVKISGDNGFNEIGDLEYRIQQFKLTFKIDSLSRKLSASILCALIIAFFVALYLNRNSQVVSINYTMGIAPLFYERCRQIHLAMALIRERVLSNNSMVSFEEDMQYGRDIDVKFNDLHIDNEFKLVALKSNYKSIIQPMIQQLDDLDSPQYCDFIVREQESVIYAQLKKSADIYTAAVATNEYSSLLKTIHKATEYARIGNLTGMKELRSSFNQTFQYADYDLSTPLHHAVRFNATSVISYLIEEIGVYLNPKDRFGNTPLDYVHYGTQLEAYLISKGLQRTFNNNTSVNLTQISGSLKVLGVQESRLLYACYYNDLNTVHVLKALKVNIDVKDYQGRTPLHVASSEGNYEIVTFLVASGATVQIIDGRGQDARIAAYNSGNMEEYNLLNHVISSQIVRENCKTFSNAIFQNGMGQAMGAYHKKFQDILIQINSTNDYLKRLTLISGSRFVPQQTYITERFSSVDIAAFITGAELYFSSVISSMSSTIEQTYAQSFTQYRLVIMVVYVMFIGLMVLAVVVMRKQLIVVMSEDIFKSRGILNLIPNTFFEQNKAIVEGLMQKLKF